MPDLHTTSLLKVAPEIAARFRADPKLAAFLDPAVHVEVDNEGHETTDGRQFTNESPKGLPIAVFVIDKDKCSATLFRAPDPRTAPNVWPWTGREDDEVRSCTPPYGTGETRYRFPRSFLAGTSSVIDHFQDQAVSGLPLLLPGVGGNSGGLPFSSLTCTPSGFVIIAVQPGSSQPSAKSTASAIRENSPLALPEPPGAVLRQLTFQGPSTVHLLACRSRRFHVLASVSKPSRPKHRRASKRSPLAASLPLFLGARVAGVVVVMVAKGIGGDEPLATCSDYHALSRLLGCDRYNAGR
jgi:hypothetical protein